MRDMTARVLFVTSDGALGRQLEAGLAGFDVGLHESLVGLYAAVLRQTPDVLVIDAGFPAMSLESAVKFLRSKQGTLALPVVLYLPRPTGPDDDKSIVVQMVKPDEFAEHTDDLKPLRHALRRLLRREFDDATSTDITHRPSALQADRPRALVVDDDVISARLLAQILATRYLVVSALDGSSAIAECRNGTFKVVVCSLDMVAMSGADVYRAVAELDAAVGERFVFLRASAPHRADEEFLSLLKNPVVKKPFTMREILAAAELVAQ